MLSLRHSSASASMNYQERNVTSEENRLEALGFEPPTKTSTSPQVASYPLKLSQDKFSQDELIDLEEVGNSSNTLFKTSEDDVEDFKTSTKNFSTDLVVSQRTIENTGFLNHPDAYPETEIYARRLENLPSTQAAIDLVKRDVEEFEAEAFYQFKNKSEERRQIVALGEQVNDLRNKCNNMAKELFYYKEMERRGELIIKPSSANSLFSNNKCISFSNRPLNPYSKMKNER